MKKNLYAIVTVSALAASLALAPGMARAQTPAPVTKVATASIAATITAIDYTQRIVTLQFADKSSQQLQVGPEVTRFPQLKVGDQLTLTETDSLVYSIAKPGATPPAAGTAAVTAGAGSKPNGSATSVQTTIVTVMAIDPATPSITVKTADGRTVSLAVKDPKNLTGVKVGDNVQITYTRTLSVSVK